MSLVEFKVNEEAFEEEVKTIKSRFELMANTMKSIGLLIKLNTTEYVPLDNSDLEQSYEMSPVLYKGDKMIMIVGYGAVDENTGYHYAKYQHEKDLFHPKRGVQYYLKEGISDSTGEIFQLIETDYLSLLNGGTVTSSALGW